MSNHEHYKKLSRLRGIGGVDVGGETERSFRTGLLGKCLQEAGQTAAGKRVLREGTAQEDTVSGVAGRRGQGIQGL